MQSLLIGESAQPAVEERIRALLSASRDVQRVIHMRTVHLGPDDLLVVAKIKLIRA